MDLAPLKPLQDRLEHHPVYAAVRDLPTLRTFMEHHVYSVWDFMSLLKALQQQAAPAAVPWLPGGNGPVQRFINEIVLEEESDVAPGLDGASRPMSHFEMYLEAMEEVEADTSRVRGFLDGVRANGLDAAMANDSTPNSARDFMRATFACVHSGKPHSVAASFALGREHVIPAMFRSLLRDMHIGETEAPMFHYYLNRHVELDEIEHGPLALQMLDALCEGERSREEEAQAAAVQALEARLTYWDAVQAAL